MVPVKLCKPSDVSNNYVLKLPRLRTFDNGRGHATGVESSCCAGAIMPIAVDPTIVADQVRDQVAEVALICNRILATTGAFVHPQAIRNDLTSAVIALELAEIELSKLIGP
jgi:hypothetical protein